MEGFGHVEKNYAGDPLFAEIPGNSFNEAGQLQERAMSGSEPKLLVPQQSAFVYCFKILASRIFSNNLPIVSKRLMSR